jgi:hypothetical protein
LSVLGMRIRIQEQGKCPNINKLILFSAFRKEVFHLLKNVNVKCKLFVGKSDQDPSVVDPNPES